MLKFFLSIMIMICTLQSSVSVATEFFKGIDVSFYQGEINFQELSSSGIKYLYNRAGEGGNIVDSRFEENYKGAETEDLNFGFYYYVTAKNTDEGEIQAEHFASLISDLPYSLRPAMDFEEFTGISQEESNEIALSFLKKLEELTGMTPVIYSDAYNVETRWNSTLSDYPLWVADYGHLAEPQQYTLSENAVWTEWSGYQYTDSAIVSGISGNVDGDLFTSSLFFTQNSETATTGTLPKTLFSYTVKKGDTLWQISQIFQTSVAVLTENNNISNINEIYVGEVLEIPTLGTYTVVSGDTLTKIASNFNTTVDVLVKLNHIQDIDLIFVGEILNLP